MKNNIYLTQQELQNIKLIIIEFKKAYFEDDKVKNMFGKFPRHVEVVRNYFSENDASISQWLDQKDENYLSLIQVLIDILRILNQNPGSIQRCLKKYGVLAPEKLFSSWFREERTGKLYQDTANRIENFLMTLDNADNVQKAYLEWADDNKLNEFTYI